MLRAVLLSCVLSSFLPACTETVHLFEEEISTPDVPIVEDVIDTAEPEAVIAPEVAEDVGAEEVAEEDTSPPPDTKEPGPPAASPRECVVRFEYTAFGTESSVSLAGEFNDWDPAATPMTKGADGNFAVDLDTAEMAPGSYAYKFVVDGDQWQLDFANPMRKLSDGIENSKVIVPDCRVPLLELESLDVTPEHIEAVVMVRDGADGAGLLADTAAVHVGVAESTEDFFDAESGRFFVSLDVDAPGKYSLRFEVANAHGNAEPLYLPLWVEETPFDWRDAVLYFAMTDRFADGDPVTGTPDGCLPDGHKANWQGGDWKGVQQRIEQGYFDNLGVDAIWLTAVVDNPQGCFHGLLGKQYTSYHGYFPSSQLSAEGQLGSLEDLKSMVAAAHARGIRVLVDLVANHLHDTHPLVSQHPEWFHDYLSCGGGGFESAPIQCWFESYLPDINYEHDAIVEEMSDAALWWVREADLDGFRIDAVKHMHDNFVRTVRYKLETAVETTPGALFWTVGETFTGDWDGGNGPNETIIKKYVGPEFLHGQFDFPLYWRILRVFAREEAPPLHLTDLLEESQGYYGPDAIMSNFLGNHDVPRFISHAAGQIGDVWGNGAKEQGWDAPPGQPSDPTPYDRAKLAFTFLFTVPGVPLIYYGDEIGLPGAGDPDNRRPMVFDGWSTAQQGLYAHIGTVAAIRRNNPALSRGSYQTRLTTNDVMVFERTLDDARAIVALNRSGSAQTVSIPEAGSWTDALTQETFSASSGQLTISAPARGARILLP